MEMKEIMGEKNFAVLGDTLNPEKIAHTIKISMTAKGYRVFPVGNEISSLNDIEEKIDVVDICMNPLKALKLLEENKKDFKCVVLQPGTDGEALVEYLEKENIPYVRGCLLKGLKEFR